MFFQNTSMMDGCALTLPSWKTLARATRAARPSSLTSSRTTLPLSVLRLPAAERAPPQGALSRPVSIRTSSTTKTGSTRPPTLAVLNYDVIVGSYKPKMALNSIM